MSEETRSSYPDVPWRQVVDMRNLEVVPDAVDVVRVVVPRLMPAVW